jgi:hypothetical protein
MIDAAVQLKGETSAPALRSALQKIYCAMIAAFHPQWKRELDVLPEAVSLLRDVKDGWHCGSKEFSRRVDAFLAKIASRPAGVPDDMREDTCTAK